MLLERAYTMKGNITRRRGVGLTYSIVIMVVLCGMVSFAVDMGRVVIVKTQLRAAADAAALGAAQYVLYDLNQARSVAVSTANANLADGSPVVLDANVDVEFVKWDEATRTSQPASSTIKPNAV